MSKVKRANQESGRCAFCGGTGLTKEHIWSDWITKAGIIPQPDASGQQVIHADVDSSNRAVLLTTFSPKDRQGRLLQRKLRIVCRNCNGGWMSEAVSRAKTFAAAIMRDEQVQLDMTAQRDLSTWLAITTATAEFTDKRHIAITDSERKSIQMNKLPPEMFTISVGRYSGIKWHPTRYRHHFGQFQESNSLMWPPAIGGVWTHNLNVTVNTIGALIFQVVSSTSSNIVSSFRSRWIPQNMITIWPLGGNSVDWRTNAILGDNDADAAFDGFFYSLLGESSK